MKNGGYAIAPQPAPRCLTKLAIISKHLIIFLDEAFLIRDGDRGECFKKEPDDKFKKYGTPCRETFYIDSEGCLIYSPKRVTVGKKSNNDDNIEVKDEKCTKISYNIDGNLKDGNKCLYWDSDKLKERQSCSSSNQNQLFVLERGKCNTM